MNERNLLLYVGRLLAACATVLALVACGQGSPAKLMSSAKEYLAKGDKNAAVIQLKNLIQQTPDDGEARLLLGQTQLDLLDFASAEKEFRRALELKQPDEKVLPLLAQAMFELNEHEKFVKEFGDRKLADPQAEATFKAFLAESYLRRGQTQQARDAYAAALAAVPGDPKARVGQATLAAMEGKTEEALKVADEVIAASPKLAEAHALRSDLLLAKGDRAGAKASLEQAVAANGNFVPARFALVTLLIDEKAYDQAAAQLAETQKLAPRDVRVSYFSSLLAFRKGETQKAKDQILQVLKVAPDNVPSLVLAGAIDLQLKSLESAEASLQRAVGRAPGHVGARRLLVATQLRRGRALQAKETLQPLIERGMPNDPQLLLLAGETYLANGDVKGATAFYQAASAKGELQQVAAKTRLGQIALATGKTEEGFKELEAASELDEGSYQADLALITNHLRRKEFDKAMAAVQALEKKQPKNPLTFQMYGIVHMTKRDVPAARRNFEKALELQPSYLPAARNLGMLDLLEKRPEDARKRFEGMIAKEPKNDQLYLALADIQARTGADVKEVIATVQRAVDADPQSATARLALINLHLRNKDAKAALSAAQAANAAFPSDVRIVEAFGVAQENAGEINQAVETYNRLATLAPQAPQPLLRLAGLYVRQKQTDKAIDALRRAQKLVPNPRDVVPQLVQALMAGDRASDALKETRELQKRDPKFAGAWALEGDIHASQKKWPDAEKAYREALKLEPKANAVAIRLHSVLAAANKTAEADALAKKWIADNPKDTSMRLYLAERDLRAKNYKSAATQYQAVLGQEPNNVAALNNLAWVLGELGDPKALDHAQRAVSLVPNNAATLDTLGMLLVKKGEASKGLEYLERARKLAPERYDIRLNYAKSLASAGQKDAARKELEALQSEPADFPGKSEIPALLKVL